MDQLFNNSDSTYIENATLSKENVERIKNAETNLWIGTHYVVKDSITIILKLFIDRNKIFRGKEWL